MSGTAIAGRGITVRFGALRANDDVTVDVPVGERRALIGPNGAGKTTLFNVLAGQRRPTNGSVELLGRGVTRMPAYRRARMGLARTFQLTNLLSDLTVRQNVQITLAAKGSARMVFWRPLGAVAGLAERTDAVLAEWDLLPVADLPVRELSHGQQRVMEIVLAVSQEPRVLLLDEPTAGLAAVDAERLTRLVASLPRRITTVLIEHDMDVAFGLADRITVLHQGRVLADGSPAAVADDERVLEAYLGEARRA